MRLPVVTLLFIGAALPGESVATAVRSAGSYPVCAVYYGVDATSTPSCSFDTREQCMETISGIGGFCIENQYYHGPTVRPPRHVHVMRKHARIRSHQNLVTIVRSERRLTLEPFHPLSGRTWRQGADDLRDADDRSHLTQHG